MIRSYTLKTVPFKMLRPALKTLMGATLMVFGQSVDDLHNMLCRRLTFRESVERAL